MLGLPSFEHRLRLLSQLPSVRRRPGGLLRARSWAAAAPGRRDPALLGSATRRPRSPRGRDPAQLSRTGHSRGGWNVRSAARVRGGRDGCSSAVRAGRRGSGGARWSDGRRSGTGTARALTRDALEPLGRPRGL